jgi:MoxR-like ATPase
VRGEPGVGKSQLARAAAVRLGRRFLQHAVDASTEPRDLLYTIDAVARLAEAQLLGALGNGSRADVSVDKFIRPGALWCAFDWEGAAAQERRADAAAAQVQRAGEIVRTDRDSGAEDRGVVLLIDEIDKADSAIPNALLDALGHRKFAVPGCGTVEMRAGVRPLVVITTNEERSLPDAFLRRCFVLHLGGRRQLDSPINDIYISPTASVR